jgi:hypothetical protein
MFAKSLRRLIAKLTLLAWVFGYAVTSVHAASIAVEPRVPAGHAVSASKVVPPAGEAPCHAEPVGTPVAPTNVCKQHCALDHQSLDTPTVKVPAHGVLPVFTLENTHGMGIFIAYRLETPNPWVSSDLIYLRSARLRP